MKSFYILYFFSIFLNIILFIYPQIPEITRLPVSNQYQSLKESAPIWITENEILVFYSSQNLDTIFSIKSNDRGLNWNEPVIVQVVELQLSQEKLWMSALKTSTGRILLVWSVKNESMKLIYSDDYGSTWSQPISILGGGTIPPTTRNSSLLNISEWDSGEICLSFLVANGSKSYYRLSTDNGVTWDSEGAIEFPPVTGDFVNELSIISLSDDTLFALFGIEKNLQQTTGLYYRVSSDRGLSWSDYQVVIDETQNEKNPKLTILDSGEIIVSYYRGDVNSSLSTEHDIYYLTSSDNGITWTSENKFTKYIGKDNFAQLSSDGNSCFISFLTERYSTINPDEINYNIAYGVLSESEDKFTPPKIYNAEAPFQLIDFENKEFLLRARIIDDEQVNTVKVNIDDSIASGEMYDDGLHNDGEANDSIFAGAFPIVHARYNTDYNLFINKIYLPLDNKGTLANVNTLFDVKGEITATDNNGNSGYYADDFNIAAFGSGGQHEEGTFLFSGSFLLSGVTNGEMWSNGVASAMLVGDYRSGKFGSDPDDPLNVIYSVNKNDYPFGNSWQRWKDAVTLGAEFYDGDGDGIYNPVDKNYNGTWDLNEDMPPLIGDETIWCVYNDGLPDSLRRWQVEPQGIEIRQTLFASDDPELENVIFIKYSILNTGLITEVMDSVFFGIWEDADLGDHTDDVVGCDTAYQSMFTYNNNIDDVYGENCPAFFTTFLQGPIINTNNSSDSAFYNFGELLGNAIYTGSKNLDVSSQVFFIGGDPNLNEPSTKEEARNYLEGKTRVGEYPDPCNFLYCEVRGGVNCSDVNPKYWASGDPVTDVGWINRMNVDHRNMLNTCPFKLEKDKPQEIIIAYVIGRGTDYFNSITVARENVQRAIQEYQNNFSSMTYSAPPPTNPVTSYVLYQNYPNPFNPTTTIRYELPQDGQVTIDIFDILGQKVKTILNEFQQANRYEVEFNATGLASGIYIYQLNVNDFVTSRKMLLIK